MNTITSVLLFILSLIAFLLSLLLKIDDFEKYWYTCIGIGDFIGVPKFTGS